jgi:hypothetical protein
VPTGEWLKKAARWTLMVLFVVLACFGLILPVPFKASTPIQLPRNESVATEMAPEWAVR